TCRGALIASMSQFERCVKKGSRFLGRRPTRALSLNCAASSVLRRISSVAVVSRNESRSPARFRSVSPIPQTPSEPDRTALVPPPRREQRRSDHRAAPLLFSFLHS